MTKEEYELYIKDHFRYENGKVFRNDRKGGMGSLDKDGYLILKIKGKQFKAHRVVWFLCNGYFPNCELDHINRIRTDNRIENLRLSNRLENNRNTTKKANKDTGVVGIYFDNSTKGLKAKYSFHKNGKTYRFRTLAEAITKKEILNEQTYSNTN